MAIRMGGRMTPDRESHLLRTIPSLESVDESLAFRKALSDAGEQLTAMVMQTLNNRIEYLVKREGRR